MSLVHAFFCVQAARTNRFDHSDSVVFERQNANKGSGLYLVLDLLHTAYCVISGFPPHFPFSHENPCCVSSKYTCAILCIHRCFGLAVRCGEVHFCLLPKCTHFACMFSVAHLLYVSVWTAKQRCIFYCVMHDIKPRSMKVKCNEVANLRCHGKMIWCLGNIALENLALTSLIKKKKKYATVTDYHVCL